MSTTTSVDPKICIIIRECAGLISVSLCNLFNKSFHSGIFTAVFNPLFNQGEASFERIVYDQLYNFLSNEHIISTHQSGFRSLYSTLTALLEATDNWAFKIDCGNVNTVVFLDLKKAFDTVDHDIL